MNKGHHLFKQFNVALRLDRIYNKNIPLTCRAGCVITAGAGDEFEVCVFVLKGVYAHVKSPRELDSRQFKAHEGPNQIKPEDD